jgi:hypothetical protein
MNMPSREGSDQVERNIPHDVICLDGAAHDCIGLKPSMGDEDKSLPVLAEQRF